MHTPRPHDNELKFFGASVSAYSFFGDTNALNHLPSHSRMFSSASHTVRISGISPDTQSTDSLKQQFQECMDVKPKRMWFGRRRETEPLPLMVSLARYGDSDMGTITFPTEDSKLRTLKRTSSADWSLDDTFAGLTVLHSAPEPDLDICAVHGLNGNAFDTFAWEGRQMWLRDFLPEPRDLHPELTRLRVMTYGYSSLLRDNKNTTGLDEWSLGLIQSVAAARRSPSERSRPIIFVCHSLGGIVAREAMIRLERFPVEGLKLEHCGLLFLSTPHSGTVEADWNDLWLLLGKRGGVSRGQAFTQLLSSFNQASVNAQEQFAALKPVPPVECLYETQKTSVAGTKRIIVSQASAGLISRAKPMLNVDHRTICRFPDMHNQGYMQVLDCLDNIRKKLVASQRQIQERHGAPPTNFACATGIRGGDAIGGNATSNDPDAGEAEGGFAAGGDVEASSHPYHGGVLMGGTGTGGSAVGKKAVGGSAAGGSVSLR